MSEITIDLLSTNQAFANLRFRSNLRTSIPTKPAINNTYRRELNYASVVNAMLLSISDIIYN